MLSFTSQQTHKAPAPVSEEMEVQGSVYDPVQSSADGETRLGSRHGLARPKLVLGKRTSVSYRPSTNHA